MRRSVLLSTQAQREFAAIVGGSRTRVRAALLAFAESGRGDVKKLKGVHNGADLYRLRVGPYRVIFELAPEAVRVTRNIHRSEGYDWL